MRLEHRGNQQNVFDHPDFIFWNKVLAIWHSPEVRATTREEIERQLQPFRMRRQIMGREIVAITKGKLDFGPWEQIFYGEFDGHRPKRVLVKVIGE